MSSLADDQAHLLHTLARHNVEFVVVGGVAAQIHGWQAATVDLDIAVAREEDNVERLNRALAEVGAGPQSVGQFGSAFSTRYGRLEIVARAHGIGQYAHWLARAEKHELADGLTVMVAAADDILRSKEAAGREKDLAALEQMKKDFEAASAERGDQTS